MDNKSVISNTSTLNQTRGGTTYRPEFSYASTSNIPDDIFFAESEATRLKTKVLKLNGKTRSKLWEKNDKGTGEDREIPIMKRILEIKDRVRKINPDDEEEDGLQKKSKHIKTDD